MIDVLNLTAAVFCAFVAGVSKERNQPIACVILILMSLANAVWLLLK